MVDVMLEKMSTYVMSLRILFSAPVNSNQSEPGKNFFLSFINFHNIESAEDQGYLENFSLMFLHPKLQFSQ